MIRLSKVLLVSACALYATLVAFGNLTDYETNYRFVRHVFMMDTIFPDANIHYRAINSSRWQTTGYILIILAQTLTAILCWLGAYELFYKIRTSAYSFTRAKKIAIAGLTLGFLTWQIAFMSIGGEWFGMWMSATWNGVESAFRIFITFLLVLIYVAMPEPAPDRLRLR